MFKKLNKGILISIFLLIFFGVFFMVRQVLAFEFLNIVLHPINTIVLSVVGTIVQIIVVILGAIISIVISTVISIAKYSNFVNELSIINAWVIVRDFCNMLFILVLLVIAFATILRIENYSWKKMLPKLLIMAVLINFSKTICGLIIDASQVVMLTFMNAVGNTGGNFINTLGVQKYLNVVRDSSWGKDLNLTSTVMGIMLGMIFLVIATVVMIVFLAALIMRIVMLWIYIVLSPLAFLLSAFPQGQTYAKQWWSDFISNVITGPVLAFFLWLSLISVGVGQITGLNTPTGVCFGPSSILCPDNFLNFVIAIGMLIGGLVITQKVGGAAGSVAGKGLDWAKRSSKFVGKKMYDNYGVDKLQQKTGIDLNLPRVWSVLQERRAEKKKERYAEGQIAAGRAMTEGGRVHGILAMTGSPGDAWDEITHTEGIVPRGVMQRLLGGKRLKKWAGAMEPNLLQAEFESRFIGENEIERNTELRKLKSKAKDIDKEITKEEDKGKDKDNSKIEDLKRQKEIIDKQSTFAAENLIEPFTSAEQDASRDKAEKMRKKYSKYQTRTPFEARAAEQSVVAAKMSKIKDISAPSELLRMLQDAIKQHDKTMVKAITLKMTKDYNDNEFLGPLAGDTSHLGLKKLMREFADKGSKNYAGFGQQEAFALGSQIAELNKATNHWAATSAYAMENGRWRETTDAEHAMIRTTETGKLHPQALMRNVNRLGFGKHKGSGSYELDEAGLLTLKQVDSPGGIKQLKDNMTESTAQYLMANMKILEQVGIFTDDLLKAIREKAESVGDFDERYEQVSDKLNELKSS